MKKAMILLAGLGALDTANGQGSASVNLMAAGNLVTNGNFAMTGCTSEACISNDRNLVKEWIPDPDIEIGFGSTYNKYLGNNIRVLDLAPNSNSCVRQVIKGLTKGTYTLRFEYAARSDQKSEDCKFAVKYNTKVLKSITPLDDRIRTQQIDIQVGNETEGLIQFCSTGERNDKAGAILKSVILARKAPIQMNPDPVVVPIKKPGENLITNPNFQKNPCTSANCVYKDNQPNIVEGWIPDAELEIGYGSAYNKFLADERVLELATATNQCVRQVVRDLRPGLYDLSFQYTTRSDKPVTEGDFEVSWQGKVLKKISPVSDRLEKDTVDLMVTQGTDGVLKFCSLGPSNPQGAVLRSVFMSRKKMADQPPAIIQSQILVDSHSNKCLQRQLQMEGGQIVVSFDYKVLSNAAIRNTFTYVVIDGKPVYEISPSSDGKRISVQTQVQKGARVLGFCALGGKDEPQHKIAISNLQLEEKPVCVTGWSQDLVKNGGFEQNKCATNVDFCRYTRSNIEKSLPNWIAGSTIEIGKAAFYNKDAWSKVSLSTVSELDSTANSCIKQRIPQITQGKYQLKFDWAAKTGSSLDSSEIEVRVSGEVISYLDAKNYDINRQTLEFDLKSTPQDPILELCAGGKSDGSGATVDNVQLMKFNQC